MAGAEGEATDPNGFAPGGQHSHLSHLYPGCMRAGYSVSTKAPLRRYATANHQPDLCWAWGTALLAARAGLPRRPTLLQRVREDNKIHAPT